MRRPSRKNPLLTLADGGNDLPTFRLSKYYGPFGAGDDTTALQNTIDAAVQAGGGRVVIPWRFGTWVTAQQVVVPKNVALTGGNWGAFSGRLRQLSGVNDDFVIFDDNGDAGSQPWIGPAQLYNLSLQGAVGATSGHGIAVRTPDGRPAKIQDLSTIEKVAAMGFAKSGLYAPGGGPIIIRDFVGLMNGGYGIEIVDLSTSFEYGNTGHIELHSISGDANMGYLSDSGGAVVYVNGHRGIYSLLINGVKSEYRKRLSAYGGDNTHMGNRHAIILENCSSSIDIAGVSHIASYGQTRKPDAPILIKGTSVPNLTWRGISIRGTMSDQNLDADGNATTASVTPPMVKSTVSTDSFLSYQTSGRCGPQSRLPFNPISSNLATDPDFENSLLWMQDLDAGVSLSTTQKASGVQSLKIVAAGSGLTGAYLFRTPEGRGTNVIGGKPVNPGESWRASVRVFRPSGNSAVGNLAIYLVFTDSTGVNATADTSQAIGVAQSTWTADSWTANTLTVVGTVPAGYDRMQIRVATSSGTPPNSGDIFYIDGVKVEPEIIASRTNAASSKTTPADGDLIPLVDSTLLGSPAAAWLKKLTFANLRTAVRSFVNNAFISDSNGNEQLLFGLVASAVNAIKITNATTGNRPTISAWGDDTDVDLNLTGQGAGAVRAGGLTVTTNTGAQTLTGKRITARTSSTMSSATPSIATDSLDQYNITALATNITSMTTNLTGAPTDGQELCVRLTATGADRTITWGASFTGTLLATVLNGKTHMQRLRYDSTAAKWVGVYVDTTGY